MDMNVTPHPLLNDPRGRALVAAIQGGLPLIARPYAAVARQIGVSERDVIRMIRELVDQGVIKRLGVVVRHHELGYDANAMVVWDVPDGQVAELGRRLGAFPFVTLCYRRPRRLPQWRYNLFTMIHGRDRGDVQRHIDALVAACGLDQVMHQVLFSTRRFKQRGAHYGIDVSAGPGDADGREA